MSLKNRRLSLDSSVCLDGVGFLRRGSRLSKRSNPSQSLNEAQLEIQELSRSLNTSLREGTNTEKNLNRPDGLISTNSFLKHNKTFHKLFEEISEEEKATHALTCALQKEVLYHGKLFVSENYVCFYSSVLLKDTKVVIPASSVWKIKKQNSALSMLSIQTADGEKYSFAYLRNREKCYKLLHTVCSQAQVSNYSSLDDSVDHGLSRQNSICLDSSFPHLTNEVPTSRSFSTQSSITDEDDRGAPVAWIWRITERIAPFVFLREIRNLSGLFYIYMMLLVLLLLASGYIGLRITALEEQLNSLGALAELSFQNKEYQDV
ncbi:hypothetical protein LDENG_00297690 [Lucifuga dentata]|nr:hypothetical protein LDENG_00297690 [Lucifuga dentata]